MPDDTQYTPVRRFLWERVFKASDVPQNVRLVGMMLATYADAEGKSMHPGIERLRRDCAYGSEKSVRRHLEVLREYGFIRRVRFGSSLGRRAVADEYVLTAPLGAVDALLHPSCDDRCDPGAYPDGGHWVYVIGEVDGDTVKIGHSSNPARRLTNVQTGNAHRLHVLAAVPGTAAIERGVHTALAGCRLSGEWFACSPDYALEAINESGGLAEASGAPF